MKGKKMFNKFSPFLGIILVFSLQLHASSPKEESIKLINNVVIEDNEKQLTLFGYDYKNSKNEEIMKIEPNSSSEIIREKYFSYPYIFVQLENLKSPHIYTGARSGVPAEIVFSYDPKNKKIVYEKRMGFGGYIAPERMEAAPSQLEKKIESETEDLASQLKRCRKELVETRKAFDDYKRAQ